MIDRPFSVIMYFQSNTIIFVKYVKINGNN